VAAATFLLRLQGAVLVALGLVVVVGGILPRGMSPFDFGGFEGDILANLLFWGAIGLVVAGFGALQLRAASALRQGSQLARVAAIAFASLAAYAGASIAVSPSSGALFPVIGGLVAVVNAYVAVVLVARWRQPSARRSEEGPGDVDAAFR